MLVANQNVVYLMWSIIYLMEIICSITLQQDAVKDIGMQLEVLRLPF